jgi:hypothetical protein
VFGLLLSSSDFTNPRRPSRSRAFYAYRLAARQQNVID